jgi:CheY-like chemotaxis protein
MHDLKVLLVEDDMIEVMKLTRAISSLKLPHEIIEASHGEAALELLEHHKLKPDLILLDLNMPKMNGIEFLNNVKNNIDLSYIPVIIFTTSSNPKDLIDVYRIGISGYILKPLKYEDYVKKIDSLFKYWKINELRNHK